MQIFCKICSIPVSEILLELPDPSMMAEESGKVLVPKGYYVASNGETFTNTEGKIIINNSDLINCTNHTNKARLNGCCGLDGQDGPNKICINGHEIGTEISDCWLPHAFIFEKDSIKTHL